MRHTPRKILLASLTAAVLLASPLAMAEWSINTKNCNGFSFKNQEIDNSNPSRQSYSLRQLSPSEQKLRQGLAAAERQDYPTAFNIFSELANQGMAPAQYNLGVMYANGRGVAQDDRQAAYWYQQAANQGDAKAQYNLGVVYTNGKGVTQDNRQAAYWYQQAANQGDAKAQHNLGVMYDNGRGMAQDFQQACYWWQKAASQTENTEVRQKALQQLKQMGK